LLVCLNLLKIECLIYAIEARPKAARSKLPRDARAYRDSVML
jgi:hypothetical protein